MNSEIESTAPFLSVIIPSFRQAVKLEIALTSISEQSFKNLEVIVVDGGLDNDTELVINKFKNISINFISEIDNGIYDAMNKGAKASRGKFLYFLGCDDKLASSNVLESVFGNGVNYNADFIYGNVIFTKEGNLYDGKFNNLKLISKNICHQAIFVKKELFDRLGGFNERYRYLADWEFNMKCFSLNHLLIKYVPVIIAYYNNDGSSFNNTDDNFLNDRPGLDKKYFSFLVRHIYHHKVATYSNLVRKIYNLLN